LQAEILLAALASDSGREQQQRSILLAIALDKDSHSSCKPIAEGRLNSLATLAR
jgi:hypothetical protein